MVRIGYMASEEMSFENDGRMTDVWLYYSGELIKMQQYTRHPLNAINRDDIVHWTEKG